MLLAELNSTQLYQAIISGCHSVINQKLVLNEINVFPVADGDTGDNMSAMANAIIQFATVKSTVKETMSSVAEASIIGARGNSGIIFSRFFYSLTKYLPDLGLLKLDNFAQALQLTAEEVYASISNPVKGTILTLMQSWAIFSHEMKDYGCFAEAMGRILPLLEEQVKETTNFIATLQKTKVVDAGALGFFYFVNGFTCSLQNKPEEVVSSSINFMPVKIDHEAIINSEPEHRYCIEAIIKADLIDKHKLLSFLNQHGDCALVTGTDTICRFHIHSNDPCIIFNSLADDYTIQYPKVDDMLRQFESHYRRKEKIALVTDSSADLPKELLDKYQIHQIPLNIHLDEHHLLDRYSFVPDNFYKRLKDFAAHPKTSCPAPAFISEKFTQLVKYYEHILVISGSGATSATYESFKTASKDFSNITVIDSKASSGAYGLLLNYAGELIAQKKELQTIINLIQEAIKNNFLFVVINQFEFIVRSGRINKFAGQIAKFTHIKPILSMDPEGKVFIFGKSFSIKTAFKKLITTVTNKIQQAQMRLDEYCIIHADAKEQALQFARMTTQFFNKPPLYIEPVSLAVGLHAGEGCIALAVRMSYL